MKKKILSIALVVAMLAIAVIGGTLAYFTDTDSAKNVMTIGNVSIIQNEQQREFDADGKYTGNLEDFADGKDIIPAVYYDAEGNVVTSKPANWDPDEYTTDGETANLIGSNVIANQVDKIVSVTNDGSRDAYVRTIFLWQDAVGEDGIHLADKIAMVWTENNSGEQDTGYYNWVYTDDTKTEYLTVEIDGVKYIATVHYYNDVLAAGATSKASLKSFWLNPKYDSNDLPDEYNVLALSQAVQTEGFTDDQVALNAAFGEIDATNLADWFADVK